MLQLKRHDKVWSPRLIELFPVNDSNVTLNNETISIISVMFISGDIYELGYYWTFDSKSKDSSAWLDVYVTETLTPENVEKYLSQLFNDTVIIVQD